MTTAQMYDDLAYARWWHGVLCCNCHDEGVPAVGLTVEITDNMIEVDPVCATCADSARTNGNAVHMFASVSAS